MSGIMTIFGLLIIVTTRSLHFQTKRCFTPVLVSRHPKNSSTWYVSVHKLETGLQARVECSLRQDACPSAQAGPAYTLARGGARCYGGAGGAVSHSLGEVQEGNPTDAMTEIGCLARSSKTGPVKCPIYGAVLACAASRRARGSYQNSVLRSRICVRVFVAALGQALSSGTLRSGLRSGSKDTAAATAQLFFSAFFKRDLSLLHHPRILVFYK